MKTLKIEQNGLTQTIQLHYDYKVTVDDEVIVIEQKEYVPKIGDCVKMQYKGRHTPTFCLIDEIINMRIYAKNVWIKSKDDTNVVLFENSNFSEYDSIEQITPEQLQDEFNKLGYHYDFTTHTASKLKWIPKFGDKYYHIGNSSVVEHKYVGDVIDIFHLSINDFHKTKEDAEKFIQYLKDYEQNK